MAAAITILTNFPCCCDQLALFWYNIHEDTQTDHCGGEGGRQEWGQLVIFPSRSGYRG